MAEKAPSSTAGPGPGQASPPPPFGALDSHLPPIKTDPTVIVTSQVGHLSPYAQKLCAQLIIWTGSNVLWGANLDVYLSTNRLQCNGYCIYNFICGIGSCLAVSCILLFNYLCETYRMSRSGWFSYALELYMMYILVLWWIPGVAVASSSDNFITPTGEVWAYLSLFASMFAAFAAYRTLKYEEMKKAYINRLAGGDDEDEEEDEEDDIEIADKKV
mmetsp:Transcript_11348/g.19415  ORF Transcript_11348/g.19415 Transcript_11348/m.19415 type:complete len:216 (-) Transcript_11348:34-681(-)|eukprot:CAMPEP_0184694872 /NCGR_PEP_ID=MMETSP0313-20130426/2694_1 /TAXON_ID=2792 /ORGANISM="Porphyridium aerugineum, Strain SAG 1380-2" /LENGTH=215 /DNA_ID=CAMNT_0027153231 /DNA_START=104 /DNA_END=751 /DNA_ORIENTATION=-